MITIVTPCHNQGRYLSEAIESVLRQTVTDFEYLIYDDGSTDNTWDVIKHYAEMDERIRAVRLPKQKNVGVVLNMSIDDAVGEHWVWCPADDRLAPTLLEHKKCWAEELPDWVLYDNWFQIDAHGNVLRESIIKPMSAEDFADEVWLSSPIGFTGIWIPTHILRKIPFPDHLQFSEDFYWMIKATIRGVKFFGIPDKLHYKRVHPDRLTDKNLDAILAQIPEIRADLLRYKESLCQ